MYESFFDFKQRPFSATPGPQGFVAVESARRVLAELLLCAHGGQGIGILTAPTGTGKTIICQKIATELQHAYATVFLAHSNFPTRRSLLQAILYELDRPYLRRDEQELRLELATAIKAVRPEKEGIVLIVDEAHLLSDRLLEEIRTLTNLIDEGVSLVRVVLSGQLSLEEKLTAPSLQALNQRVRCQVTLEPLTRLESAEYIMGRLKQAGANLSEILTREAVEMICQVSDGLPRCLNQICDHSLLLGYIGEEKPVGLSTVQEAFEDLRQLPLQWNDPPPLSTSAAPASRQSVVSPPVTHAAAVDWRSDNDLQGSNVESIEIGAVEEGEQSPCVAPLNSAAGECLEAGAPADRESWDGGPPENVQHIEAGAADASSQNQADGAVARQPDATETIDRSSESRNDFEDELVVDRYARLDAGLPVYPEQWPDVPFVEEESVGEARPDRLIDEMAPLLKEAMSLETDDGGIDSSCGSAKAGVDSGPTVDLDEGPQLVNRAPLAEQPEQYDEEEVEEQIGSAVLDACLQTQHAIETRLNDGDRESSDIGRPLPRDGKGKSAEVVGGEHDGFGPNQPRCRAPHPVDGPSAWLQERGEIDAAEPVSAEDRTQRNPARPRQHYDRLFSNLRRRRQSEDEE